MMTDLPHPAVESEPTGRWRPLLWWLAAATFLIFFQAFMITPLIPRLPVMFGSTPSSVGWAVPAGFSTALVAFGGIGLLAAGLAVPLFASPRPPAP